MEHHGHFGSDATQLRANHMWALGP
jgi:hypothetical protein